MYKNWYFSFFLDDCLLSWFDNSRLKKIISTNCCIHTVVPPGGPRYARKMWKLTKYIKLQVVHQVYFSLRDYIEMHGQHNIKKQFFFSGLPTDLGCIYSMLLRDCVMPDTCGVQFCINFVIV